MKYRPIALLSAIALAGCSASSEEGGDSADDALKGSPAEAIVFSRDDRPSDGALIEVRLDRTLDGTYDVTLHTNSYNRLAHKEEDSVTKVASKLACSSVVSDIRCARDLRPVDGSLTELTIVGNSSGKFDAKLHTEGGGRAGQSSSDQVLGTNLRRQALAAKPIVFAKDDRPVDGALIEVFVARNGEGTYDVTLHTNSYDRLAHKERDATTSVATNLSCSAIDPEVRCARDLRPVDGALTELTIVRNASGKFDAKLHTEVVGRGGQSSSDQILGTDLSKR